MGPILFLMFINDMHLYIGHCDSNYYADESDVEAKLPHDGNTSNVWGRQNKIDMHYDKTSCMLIGTRHRIKKNQQINIYIDGNTIKKVNKQKLLGIYIDENLHWSDRID